ncbi:MAG TPA: hypothetical protein VFH73_18990, partial [Polyangia bacterium]|nr:hypothetical protein [Polyangia bacterium]
KSPEPTPDVYPWIGASEQAVEVACARIARRLRRDPLRIVGFLAAPGVPSLLPVMVRVGRALFAFEPRRVGIIGPWQDWDGTADEPGSLDVKGHGPVLRPLPGLGSPDLVVPPRAPDPDTALLSLQLALRRTDDRFPQVLLDLTGWVGPSLQDVLSVAVGLTGGTAIVAAVGLTTLTDMRRTWAKVRPDKNLGVVLVG